MRTSAPRDRFLRSQEAKDEVPSAESVLATMKIHNVTGQSSLGMEKVPLRALCMRTVNCELKPGRLDMRIVKPHSYAQIHSNGTLVVYGCFTPEDCRAASRRFARIIQSAGYPVKFGKFRVVNMMATIDFGLPVDLQALAEAHKNHVDFQADHHASWLRFHFKNDTRIENKSITAQISYTGRMTMVGAKKDEELREAFDVIYPIVIKHRFFARGVSKGSALFYGR